MKGKPLTLRAEAEKAFLEEQLIRPETDAEKRGDWPSIAQEEIERVAGLHAALKNALRNSRKKGRGK